jgi:predicted methyltransferase
MRAALSLLAFALVSTTAIAATSTAIATALASADRPAADTQRDANRKPAELLAFAGVKPGQRVADIMPGGGYFTRIFSKVVGPNGKVYAAIPAELLQVAPKAADGAKAIAASPAFANVSVVVAPSAQTAAPEPVDVAWTSDNYHDVYGSFGADQAAQFDAAVFRMLRPGGEFIVIDHAAAAGNTDAPKTLHRIDPAVVKAQVVAAGFVFEGASDALANPADDHTLKVFDPTLRGHTDQFVFKFRKPRK